MRRGRITSTWSDDAGVLTTAYRNGDFSRCVRIRTQADCPAMYANGRLSFDDRSSRPAQIWRGCAAV